MKNFKYLLWTFLATALAAGCTDDPTYTRGAEEDPNTYGVYFPTQSSPTEVEVSSADPLEVTYKVCRTRYIDAITVPVEVTTSDEGIFDIEPLFFGPGEKETEFKVSFPNAQKGKEYTCDIRIVDPHYISIYGPNATSLSFSVIRADWVPLTSEDGSTNKGKWRDDLISNLYSTNSSSFNPNPEIEVEMYERDDKPGLYRMKVYNAAFMKAMTGNPNFSYQSRDVYTIIDASDPDKVYIPYQNTGLSLLATDGEIRIASNVSENFSMDESGNQYGTLKDGVITFPTQSIMLELEKHSGVFYYGNMSGLLRIQLPGVQAPDYTVKLTKHEPEDGVVNIDAAFSDDAKLMKYALYDGVVDDGQASLYAQDLDAAKADPDTFNGSISESGTIKIEGLKTGKYTLVGCIYGEEGGDLKGYAYVSFGYVAAGEEKEIDLTYGLEASNEFAGQGISSDNAVKFYAYGSEIESLTYGLFRTSSISGQSLDDLLDKQGTELSDEELENLNDGHFSTMLTGLNGDSEYTFALRVNNGYFTRTMSQTHKTTGTFNPGLEYYSYSDYLANGSQPSLKKLTGTTWNYYAINLMDDEPEPVRRRIGEVTMYEDPELSTSSQPVVRIKGLSGIDFTSGGEMLGYYIPNTYMFSGYTGALGLYADGEQTTGIYLGQKTYLGFMPSDGNGIYFSFGMFLGAVADGYLYVVASPAAVEQGLMFSYLFTGSVYDLFSLTMEMMLVDPEKDMGGIPPAVEKNIALMREKIRNGFRPRNFVELPEFGGGQPDLPAFGGREAINVGVNRIPASMPTLKRAEAKFSVTSARTADAGTEMTFKRIGKKVE